MEIVTVDKLLIHRHDGWKNVTTSIVYERKNNTITLFEQRGSKIKTIAKVKKIPRTVGYSYNDDVVSLSSCMWGLGCVNKSIRAADWYMFSRLVVSSVVGSDNESSGAHDYHNFDWMVRTIKELSGIKIKEEEEDD